MQFAVAYKFCNALDGDTISFSSVDECTSIGIVDDTFVLLAVAKDGSVWNDRCDPPTPSELSLSEFPLGGLIGCNICACLDFFEDDGVAGFFEHNIVGPFLREGINDELQDDIEQDDRGSLEDDVESSSK